MSGLVLLLLQVPIAMWNIAGERWSLLPLSVAAALIGLAIMVQDER